VSLGADFWLGTACTWEWRGRLRAAGLNPYLLRLSVGTEPPAAVVRALRRGFDAAAACAAVGEAAAAAAVGKEEEERG